MNACCSACMSGIIAQTFDCLDALIVAIERERQARSHGLAVGQHRASAADALIASPLCAGQQQLIANDGEQRIRRDSTRLQRGAVDIKSDSVAPAHAAALEAATASLSARDSMRGIRSFAIFGRPTNIVDRIRQ